MTLLGDKINKHRTRLGLSIQDLAVSAGMVNVHLRALEEGTPMGDDPKVSALSALARALGISPLLLAAAAFDDLETGEG